MISGPEAVARSARSFSECANDSGHYTYIIVISLTFVKCFLEKSSALPGQMGAKFRQNEEDTEGKKKLAGFVRVSKGYPEEQRREKAEICRVASCILILGEESAIISMLSIQQNAPVCRNGRRGGLKIPCANNTCGFDPHHRHKKEALQLVWGAFFLSAACERVEQHDPAQQGSNQPCGLLLSARETPTTGIASSSKSKGFGLLFFFCSVSYTLVFSGKMRNHFQLLTR